MTDGEGAALLWNTGSETLQSTIHVVHIFKSLSTMHCELSRLLSVSNIAYTVKIFSNNIQMIDLVIRGCTLSKPCVSFAITFDEQLTSIVLNFPRSFL